MKVFVIHRFKDRRKVKSYLKKLAKESSIELAPILLDSTKGERWKSDALAAIKEAEAVIVVDRQSCDKSVNALWEMQQAAAAKKQMVDIDVNGENGESIEMLRQLYEMKDEFDACFSSNGETMELYKIMVDSSESLIQRRQRMNTFFIAVIGSLLAIAGFLVKTGAVKAEADALLYAITFAGVGLALCYSWRNLIDNYGKLNKAKFDVILRLEKNLGARVYYAEWVASGKGIRRKKYKSFTSTEKNVPLVFSALIIILTLGFLFGQFFDN